MAQYLAAEEAADELEDTKNTLFAMERMEGRTNHLIEQYAQTREIRLRAH